MRFSREIALYKRCKYKTLIEFYSNIQNIIIHRFLRFLSVRITLFFEQNATVSEALLLVYKVSFVARVPSISIKQTLNEKCIHLNELSGLDGLAAITMQPVVVF